MTTNTGINLITVLGPTASGKTRLAVALARQIGAEIISADSRQVFRRMDIGTGKDLHEYDQVPYHLIDILEPGEEFSLFAFQQLFWQTFAQVSGRGRLPLLCGGTGLYLDAILRDYRLNQVPEDPELRSQLAQRSDTELAVLLRQLRPEQHNSTDLCQRERMLRAIEIARHQLQSPAAEQLRPEIRPLVIGIRWEREQLRRRITQRLRSRMEQGLLDEVQRLHTEGVAWERLEAYGLEYRFVAAHLRGEMNRNDLFQRLNSAIHQFAKRQESWFRGMERKGVPICWVNGDGEPLAEALAILDRAGLTSGDSATC